MNIKKNKFNCSLKKQIIAQSILWAIAMLSVAIFDNKEFVVLILILLSYMSVYIFRNHHTGKELTDAVEDYEKKLSLGRDHQKLNNRLEELRRKAGLTQQDLSEKAEVSRKSINAIENGIYVPSTVLALKIAKTLKCKVEDLFKLPL